MIKSDRLRIKEMLLQIIDSAADIPSAVRRHDGKWEDDLWDELTHAVNVIRNTIDKYDNDK